MKSVSRRDFLKLFGITMGGIGLTGLNCLRPSLLSNNGDKPNIILLVLDAMSAKNLSVYGYRRPSTPNLERFAQRATVFHSHYSAGNYTTSGAASMLTGLLPWNHRAFTQRSLVRRDLETRSVFHSLGDDYYRLGYSQNPWSDLFLRQFRSGLDQHLPLTEYLYKNKISLTSHLLPDDSLMAYYVMDEFLVPNRQVVNPYPGSALLGYIDYALLSKQQEDNRKYKEYPFGMPTNTYYDFRHPDLFDGLRQLITGLPSSRPWFTYLHLYSPHAPYRPRFQFTGKLPDIELVDKKQHVLSEGQSKKNATLHSLTRYDEFISDLDFEIGAFIDALEQAGILDTSYLIITSDHGEMFERGEIGHGSLLLFDPVIHIPLLISSPGQTTRQDVYTPTSNVDLLPTIAHISGGITPSETDGRLLPGFGGVVDDARSVFSVMAKANSSFQPISRGTISMQKGNLKLIYYHGYEEYLDQFEFFDLENDPEEIRNLVKENPSGLSHLKEELLSALEDANRRFR